MVGRFDTGRFRSSFDQEKNVFHDAVEMPPPPPPPSFITTCNDEDGTASSLDTSVKTPSPWSRQRRGPSQQAKNRYRDLSRKAQTPLQRGRQKVLMAERFRMELEEKENQEAEIQRRQEEMEAPRLKEEQKLLQQKLTNCVFRGLVDWLSLEEYRAKRVLQEKRQKELERQQALEQARLQARRAEQEMVLEQASSVIEWLREKEHAYLRAKQAKLAKEAEQRRIDQIKTMSQASQLVEWLVLQEIVSAQQRRLREAEESRAAIIEELALLQQQKQDQETLSELASRLIKWLVYQEFLDRERRLAQEQARQEEEARKRDFCEKERVLVSGLATGLVVWLTQQEEAAMQRRARQMREDQMAKELREKERAEEQALVSKQAGILTVWITSMEQARVTSLQDKKRPIFEQEEEKKEDDSFVPTPPSTPTGTNHAVCGAVGAAVVGGAVAAAAASNNADKERTVIVSSSSNDSPLSSLASAKSSPSGKSNSTPATAATDTTSLTGGEMQALLIPSSSSSSRSSRTSSSSSLVPSVVGRRSSNTITVVANGRVRSRGGSCTSLRLSSNRSLRRMQSPGVPSRKSSTSISVEEDESSVVSGSSSAQNSSRNLLNTSVVSTASTASSSSQDSLEEDREKPIKVTVNKESRDTKAGIAFKKDKEGRVFVSKIARGGGLFARSALGIGYEVISINSVETKDKSLKDVAKLIRHAEGDLVVVAQAPKTYGPNNSAWPVQDPGYLHAQKAGTLWQTLVGHHVRFPSSWWNGSRCAQMGVRDVIDHSTNERISQHAWRYIAVDSTTHEALNKYVPDKDSPGRLLLHIVIRDETWEPVQDLAIGAYHDLEGTPCKVVWMAIRKRSGHKMGSTSLIDPILTSECSIENIATDSPLKGGERVRNSHLRSVFGNESPERTVFILESELVKRLRTSVESAQFIEVSLMMLDLFLFSPQ